MRGRLLLLVTAGDTPADWLRAGQALQVPALRAVVRDQFRGGGHPQMLLRLGVAGGAPLAGVRRPVEDVLTEEPAPGPPSR